MNCRRCSQYPCKCADGVDVMAEYNAECAGQLRHAMELLQSAAALIERDVSRLEGERTTDMNNWFDDVRLFLVGGV